MPDRVLHVGPLERLHCLKSFQSFRDLPQPELAVLAQHATERFFRKRRPLLLLGERVDAVHLVVEGRVRVFQDEKETALVGPGEGVGWLELFSGSEEGVRAVADTETLTLSFRRELFFDILEDHFSIVHQLIKDLCTMRLAQKEVPADGANTPVPEPGRSSSAPPPPHELDLAERIVFLRRAFPFARGRIAELAELARHATEVHIEPGAPIWSEGDEADDFLVLVRGVVAFRRGDGAGLRFGPKGTPGLLEALAGSARRPSAVAEREHVQALRLDVEHLLDVFEDNFELALEYVGSVARDVLAARAVQAAPAARAAS